MNEALTATQLLALVALADLVTGVGAALRHGRFDARSVGQWITTHILGRVAPIVALVWLSTYAPPLAAVAATAAATYVAETVASIKDHLTEEQ